MGYLPKKSGISPRAKPTISPKRVILIISEGTKTEVEYFKWLRKKLRLAGINIKIIGVGRDPLTVAEESIKECNNNYDTVYCVVDRDNHEKNRIIEAKNKLTSPNNKKIFRLILSYPCIEYWFILHLANDIHPYTQPVDGSMGRACKHRLKHEHYPAYDEGKPNILWEFFNTKFTEPARISAITRAKNLLDNIIKNDTINPSTMLFIPAIDIELMANQNLEQTITKPSNHIIKAIVQEKYEEYIKDFFDVFTRQKNL